MKSKTAPNYASFISNKFKICRQTKDLEHGVNWLMSISCSLWAKLVCYISASMVGEVVFHQLDERWRGVILVPLVVFKKSIRLYLRASRSKF